MLLLLPGPAVLFPRRVPKLLKLTYYLLDWTNMFVFCVHVCASARSPPSAPPPFILIECGGVITDECPRNYLHWISRRPLCMSTTVNRVCVKSCLVFISGECVWTHLCMYMYLPVLIVSVYQLFVRGNARELVCKEHGGQHGGSLSCNELYWF